MPPVEQVGKASNFCALNLLRIGRAEDLNPLRLSESPSIRAVYRARLRTLEARWIKTHAVSSQARTGCATSLPRIGALACAFCGSERLPFWLSRGLESRGNAIRGALAAQRFCTTTIGTRQPGKKDPVQGLESRLARVRLLRPRKQTRPRLSFVENCSVPRAAPWRPLGPRCRSPR
jgi:hypothetical protein